MDQLIAIVLVQSLGAKVIKKQVNLYAAFRGLQQGRAKSICNCAGCDKIHLQQDVLPCRVDGVQHARKEFCAVYKAFKMIALPPRELIILVWKHVLDRHIIKQTGVSRVAMILPHLIPLLTA